MNYSNTAKETEKEFVEISEDAYKQNSVYRPWTDNAPKEQAAKYRGHQHQRGHERAAGNATA
jgi:hypothetical protein